MAGAKPGVHVVQLKPISVPETLVKGNKCIMFNDNSTIGTPVTLKVDENGYILYWKDQLKEMDFLDISMIRDTRTGKEVKPPKDYKLRESLTIGNVDVALEEKIVTVVYGTDMVSLEYIHFVFAQEAMAQDFAQELLQYSINLLALNSSSLTYLHKLFSRFSLVLNNEGKVSMKNIVKQIASNREDRKKVEKALESVGFHAGKTDSVNPQKFTFDNFFNFYRHLCGRTEVDKIFDELGAKKKPYLTAQQFCQFLNKQQRDPRLNEILYPNYSMGQAEALIHKHETKPGMAQKGHLSQEGFLKFLMSEDNNLIPADKLDISEDMEQPLSHYFINSSHNTYLSGHQFTGKSSVEMYHQVLLSGCRCIELDCWDGKDSDTEPIITHGYTMCTEVLFKDVIEAIAQSAFKTSDFPVILSFENHCSPKQQAKMANYCRTIFGDMLLVNALETNPLKPDIPLPSPTQLKRKIIVKNKKKHFHRAQNMSKKMRNRNAENAAKPRLDDLEEVSEAQANNLAATSPPRSPEVSQPESPTEPIVASLDEISPEPDQIEKQEEKSPEPQQIDESYTQAEPKSPTKTSLEKKLSISSEVTDTTELSKDGDDGFDSDSDSSDSDDDDDENKTPEEKAKKKQKKVLTEEEKKRRQKMKKEKGTAGKEASAAMEMSLLVNYIQPVHFHTFDISEKRRRSYEITSFVETQGTSLLKEFPVDFVNYNKRQMSRIYPRGTRVDSSNFMPQVFWNAGCQLVALNFQTLDLAMQINLGIFEYNGRTGYILKPDFMRRPDRHFDPFAESTVDGIIAGTLSIKIISGQFLSDKKVGTYVEVEMYGLPTDTVRKRFRTKTVPNNGINPVYDEDPFVFKKVVLPNLATVRIAVFEDQNKSLIGHRILPVEGLRPGYRHIPLRNESNQPLISPTLFVQINVKDYVPDSLADYAEALSNPIAFLSSLEKHNKQLEILEDDFNAEQQGMNTSVSSQNIDTKSPSPTPEPIIGNGNRRQGSTTSHGTGVSVTAVPTSDSSQSFNRMQSQSHLPAAKQDSYNSQASGGSNNVPPFSRMTSGIPGSENGSTAAAMVQKTKLRDMEILNPTPLADLKAVKSIHKAAAKRDKELETMQKKHLKAKDSLEEQHQIVLDKLISGHTKTKINMEKVHKKTMKKQAKAGSDPDHMQVQLKGELEELIAIQDLKRRQLKSSQAKEIMKLCQKQYQDELELKKRHHLIIYDILQKLMEVNHEEHLKNLDDIHDKEVVELKKQMDADSRNNMKALSKNHKDKQELQRMKREAQTKHVATAVTERQKLKEALAKRKSELESKLGEIKQQFKRSKEQEKEEMEEYFQASMRKLEDEVGSQIEEDEVNDEPVSESSGAKQVNGQL